VLLKALNVGDAEGLAFRGVGEVVFARLPVEEDGEQGADGGAGIQETDDGVEEGGIARGVRRSEDRARVEGVNLRGRAVEGVARVDVPHHGEVAALDCRGHEHGVHARNGIETSDRPRYMTSWKGTTT
jgi:hypothetical protein